jgi:hypothetical protein
MANRNLILKNCRMRSRARVNHAVVLHVRAIADANVVHVATDRRVAPNRRLFAQMYITNHLGALINVSGAVNLRMDRAEWSNHVFQNSNTRSLIRSQASRLQLALGANIQVG